MIMETNQFPTFRSRLAIVLIVLAVIFGTVLFSLLFYNFNNELLQNTRHRLKNIATLAALQQNGDELEKVKAQGDEYYDLIQERNAKIKRIDPDIRFVYTMRKNSKDEIYFVVDARISPDEADISNYGDIYKEPHDTLVGNFDTMTETIVESNFYTDEFDTFLSAYAPIFNSKGDRVGVLGVDFLANTIITQERNYLIRLALLSLLTLPLLVLGGIISANYLAKPIIGLRDVANKII